MKILKEGTASPSKFMFYGKCQHCHCQVEVNRSDMYCIGNSYHVACPTNGCESIIKIYEKLIEVDESKFSKQSPIACCTDDPIKLKDIQVTGPGPLDDDNQKKLAEEFNSFFKDCPGWKPLDDGYTEFKKLFLLFFPSKKYTIIYSVPTPLGSDLDFSTQKDLVDTPNIASLINTDKYSSGIWYIFEGWCQDVML